MNSAECRACGTPTAGRLRLAGSTFAMCDADQEGWRTSGEFSRARLQVASMAEDNTERARAIMHRAMVDFLDRTCRERFESAGKAVAP